MNQFFSFSQEEKVDPVKQLITHRDAENLLGKKYPLSQLNQKDKDQVFKQMQVEIRTMRLQKLEADQNLKVLQNDYALYQQQNQQLKMKFEKLKQELNQISTAQFDKQQISPRKIKESNQQDNQSTALSQRYNNFSFRFLDQKSAHLEHNLLASQRTIQDQQEQIRDSQIELNKQKLINQELYSHILKLQMPDELSIQLKKQILHQIGNPQSTEINNSQSPSEKETVRKFSNNQSKTPDHNDRQWNRLIIEISKLETEKKQLFDQTKSVLDELFQQSQFLMNLFSLMDRPEFIVNLQHIRSLCSQQREFIQNRLLKLGAQQEQLNFNLG